MSRGCTECSRNLKVYESSSGFLYLAWELYCTSTAFLMINSRKPQSWLMTYVVKYWCNLYSNAKDIQIPKSHAWNSLTSVSHKSLPSDSKQLVPFKRSPFVRKSCRITWDAMVLTLNYTAICLHKQNYNTTSIFSRWKWSGWRDGLVLKNTHSSCRDPECRSQHPGQITHNRLQFHLQGVYCLCRHLNPQACAAGTKLYIQINIFFLQRGNEIACVFAGHCCGGCAMQSKVWLSNNRSNAEHPAMLQSIFKSFPHACKNSFSLGLF